MQSKIYSIILEIIYDLRTMWRSRYILGVVISSVASGNPDILIRDKSKAVIKGHFDLSHILEQCVHLTKTALQHDAVLFERD